MKNPIKNLTKLFRGGKSKSFFALGNDIFTKKKWGTTAFMSAYQSSVYVYSCVKKRAEKTAQSLEFVLYDNNGKEVEKSWILDLLEEPNQYQTKNEFFELYQTHKDLAGAVFVLLIKESEALNAPVSEMWLLPPNQVTVKVSKDTGLIVGFEYDNGSGNKQTYAPEEVLFSMYPSPLKPFEGQSALQPGSQSLEVEQQLSQYQNNVLKNGGKVEGVLKFKTDVLNEDEIESIQNKFTERFAEARNSGKPLVLYGDSEYQNLGLTPNELSFLESKKATREDILTLYQVPKTILGITDGVQKGNYAEANAVFIKDVIKPLIENIVNKFDQSLVPDEWTLGYVDPTPEDVDMALKKAESGVKNYYMTQNEARELQGLEPLPDGDKILAPFNISELGESPAPEKTAVKKKTVNASHPLRDEKNRRKYEKVYLKRFEKGERLFLKEFRKYLKGQMNRVIEGIAPGTTKGLLEEQFNAELEISLAKEAMDPVLQELGAIAGAEAMALVGSEFNYQLSSTLASTLSARSTLFTAKITETTFEQLKNQFTESFALEESRDQLVKRIEKTYGDISKGRAKTIARTEVQVANQSGTIDGYKQGGMPIKIWVTVGDGNVRDSHAMVDGQERDLNQPFDNGLMYPGDPSGSADEVINCRCTI